MPGKTKEDLFIKAAKKGDCGILRNLLAEEPNLVHHKDAVESTALHYASWNGHLEAAELLVEAGSDVNAHNKNDHYGTTPLHAAAHANRLEIAEFLLAQGAEMNTIDTNGKTPLDHTAFHKATKVSKLLIARGAK